MLIKTGDEYALRCVRLFIHCVCVCVCVCVYVCVCVCFSFPLLAPVALVCCTVMWQSPVPSPAEEHRGQYQKFSCEDAIIIVLYIISEVAWWGSWIG